MTDPPDDRTALRELAIAYSYAVDERDWDAFVALFTEDATIDYTSAGGIAGTPAAVAAWMPGALELFDWTLHSVSTHRVTIADDGTASGDVHVLARHGLVWDGTDELMDVTAVYHDAYVRTAAGWRIAARREETLAITGGAFAALADAARR